MKIEKYLKSQAKKIDKALDRFLPKGQTYPKHLAKAMRYSVFSGGKRVRPFLVLEAAKLCGGTEKNAMPLACAFEMIHAYSLVHDDLPAMDDDDMRRGRKTCHKAFDEATAILAGDALLSQAFAIVDPSKAKSYRHAIKASQVFAHAIGPYGMVAGQAADLEHQKRQFNLKTLKQINELKTGALITGCMEAGALWAGATPFQALKAKRYGQHIGLLFQLIDDILDKDGYYALIGKDKTLAESLKVRDKAVQQLKGFGKRGVVLSSFAHFLYERKA